jgi:phosphoenolpyruvate synthase/pyruvate phosphate dikinase
MVVWRENLRFKRSQAFGIVKMIFGDLGKKLALSGHLTAPNDVFFLTMDEVFTRPADLKIRVIRRRASYEMNIPRTLPARVRTRYPFDFETDAKILPEPTPDTEIRKNLRGIGCSSGIVRGKVRIIRSPDDIGSLGGDILVTESTDPGWVKLFPTASAILLERGSLLSHAGIVTREMGIPCVVGVKGLLASIRDHDTVELDGSTGEVRILT